ncbi:hypothetical protein BSKO_08778 [Bryopsis sp. KO-2023]|nr:hypothetical protein BSKO_08778 [Bryopsis sp. KO-2023]
MHKFLCLCRGKHAVDTRSIDFGEGAIQPTYLPGPHPTSLAELVHEESVQGRFPDGTMLSHEKPERGRGVNCGIKEDRRSKVGTGRSQRRRTVGHSGARSSEKLDQEMNARRSRHPSRSRGASGGSQNQNHMIPLSSDEFLVSDADLYLLPQNRDGGHGVHGKNLASFDMAISSDSSQGLTSALVDWRSSDDLSDTSCSGRALTSMGNQSDMSSMRHSAASRRVGKRSMASTDPQLSVSSLLSDNHTHWHKAREADGSTQGVPALDLSRVRRTGSYCSKVMGGTSVVTGLSVSVNDTPRHLQQWQIDLNLRWVGEDDDDLVAEVRLTDDPTPRAPGIGPITSDQNPPVLSTRQNVGSEAFYGDGRVTPRAGSVPKGIMDVVDRFLFALQTPAPHKHPTPETRKPLRPSPQRQNKVLDPASAPHELQDDIADVEAMRIVMGQGGREGASHNRQPSSLRRKVVLDDMKSQLGRLGDLLTSGELPRFSDDAANPCPLDLEKAILEDVRLEVMRLEEELVRVEKGKSAAAGQKGGDKGLKNIPGNASVSSVGHRGGSQNRSRAKFQLEPRDSPSGLRPCSQESKCTPGREWTHELVWKW